MNINQTIDNIETKAKMLAKQRDILLLEKAELADENRKLKLELAEKVKKIGELRNKLSKTQRVLTNKEAIKPYYYTGEVTDLETSPLLSVPDWYQVTVTFQNTIITSKPPL